MNRLLLILILTLNFQTFTKADDIRDFQIEGISLGDSLTEYFTKKEIISLKNSYKDKGYIYNSKKFYSITFRNHPDLNIYENIQFILKDNSIYKTKKDKDAALKTLSDRMKRERKETLKQKMGFKKGGKVYCKDGCAIKGKTKGRMV